MKLHIEATASGVEVYADGQRLSGLTDITLSFNSDSAARVDLSALLEDGFTWEGEPERVSLNVLAADPHLELAVEVRDGKVYYRVVPRVPNEQRAS